ncbi:MAG: low molecular weight protein arginine phosphatase [Candidatus Sumerlaeia bacterium]|nr:low molecular weight protein arginine phosphatase [Candidatus Sumerlaeia bacterium]
MKGLLSRRMRETQPRKVLLFLSTGNICRSPMAAAYMRKLLEERKIKNIEVRSAGVMTIAGLLATDESKQMLEPYAISLDRHRSQPLTEDIIRKADLILGMTPFHVQMALRMSPEARKKTHLLKEYTAVDPKNRPIPDPMGCTLEVYKRVFRQIKMACDKLVEMEFITGKPAKPVRAAGAAGAAAAGKPKLPRGRRPTAAATESGKKAAMAESARRKGPAAKADSVAAAASKADRISGK